MKKAAIITTINSLTKGIESIISLAEEYQVLIIGDKKSKPIQPQNNLNIFDVERQTRLKYNLVQHLPFNHYTRKNIGYLLALKEKMEIIFDTDDDNILIENLPLDFKSHSFNLLTGQKYCNIYEYYTDDFVWPRGYPLDEIKNKKSVKQENKNVKVGIWQYLANNDPDVDAIFRLILQKEDIVFKTGIEYVLDKHVYCPFNSQATLWTKETLPYAYLPFTVSFRFTDILRGYIAQRCLWEHDLHLAFSSPIVYQDRNAHNFLHDFESEIPCYIDIKKLVSILDSLSLKQSFDINLMTIYNELIKHNLVKKDELKGVRAWIDDIIKLI